MFATLREVSTDGNHLMPEVPYVAALGTLIYNEMYVY